MKNKEVEQQKMKSLEGLKEYAKENKFTVLDTLDYKIVAIGYLSIDEPFEKGEVTTIFLTKLRILWNKGGQLGSLGHHDCEFCIDEGNYEKRATSSSEKELLDDKNKIRYCFPEMIFHYIEAHKFKPSDDFIKFVMEKKVE